MLQIGIPILLASMGLLAGAPAAASAEEAPTEKVAGRILDEHGTPVAGARVWLSVAERWESSYEGPPVIAEAKSGDDGRFELKPLVSVVRQFVRSDATKFQVWAYKPGFRLALSVSLHELPGEPIRIELPAEQTVKISLRTSDGRPAANADVVPTGARFEEDDWSVTIPLVLRERLRSTSDAEGRVQISALSREQIRGLDFTHPAVGTQHYYCRPGIPVPAEVTFLPVGSIEGQLVDQSDLDIDLKDVQIRIAAMDPNLSDPDEYWAGTVIVNPNSSGRFFIPAIATGTIRLFITSPEDFPLRPDPAQMPLVVSAGETTALEIPVRPAVRVSRLVRDAETLEPVPGVRAHFQYGQQNYSARTDEAGWFSLLLLPEVDYHTVYDLPRDYRYGPDELPKTRVSADMPDDALEPVELLPGRTLTGTVLDDGGRPFAGIRIDAKWEPRVRGPRSRQTATAVSDSAGRFRIFGIEPDVDVTVTPSLSGTDLGESVTVAADDDAPLTLTTQPREFASLRGRVTDVNGPVVGAKVYVYLLRPDGKPWMALRTYSDGEGKYRTPPQLVRGAEYKITVMGNQQDYSTEFLPLEEDGQEYPEIVVDQRKVGGRLARPAAAGN